MAIGFSWSRGVLLAGLLAALAMSGAARSGEAGHAGRHHDGGRFSAQGDGFPPQLRGIREVSAASPDSDVAPRVREDGSLEAAIAVASTDAQVQALQGRRHLVLGATRQGPKAAWPGAVEVAIYSHDSQRTILAMVVEDAVAHVDEVTADRWQPPLIQAERAEAVRIARAWFVAQGSDRVDALTGLAIHALRPDGRPFGTRMAYVSFHLHVDARPEMSAWVDLTDGVVVRSGVQAPPQPAPRGGGASGPPPLVTVHPDQVSGQVSWRRWSFGYELSGRVDGLSLFTGSFQGIGIFSRLSMPSMSVFYDHPPDTPASRRCGPYVDRLGLPELSPIEWFDDQPLVNRTFTLDGVEWMELGILDTLGDYVLYQSFYISEDGQIDAHTFAKGLQCEFDHVHYPFWRFDIDLAGPADDRILRATPDGEPEAMTTEFDLPASAAFQHGWVIEDPVTQDRVRISFDDGTWTVPGEVIPEAAYEQNIVYGRRVDSREQDGWRGPASTTLGFNEAQPLLGPGSDISLWYRGFLPHTAAEGPALWHATGVRLQVEVAPRYQVRPGR